MSKVPALLKGDSEMSALDDSIIEKLEAEDAAQAGQGVGYQIARRS